VGAEVGAGGEVVVAVPGAVDGVGEEDPGIGVEELESDGGGDGLGDEEVVVGPALPGQLGGELGGEGGELGWRGGHWRAPGRGRDGGSIR
jgi:hypothetical protein